jgi:hypothetical protein
MSLGYSETVTVSDLLSALVLQHSPVTRSIFTVIGSMMPMLMQLYDDIMMAIADCKITWNSPTIDQASILA